MTSLSLSDTDPAELPVDAIVIGLYSTDDGEVLLAPGAERLASAFDGALARTLALIGATGSPGEVTKLATLGRITAPVIAAVGLGRAPAPDADLGRVAEVLRRAAATAVRSLAGAAKVALVLPGVDSGGQPSRTAGAARLVLRAVAEGALLGTYRFARYQTTPNRRDPVKSLLVQVADAADRAARAEVKRAMTVAAAVTRARDWVNTAPNDLRPPAFAEQVATAATAAGLAVEVLDEKALRRAGFGGILAVGLGSAAPPRLVRIAYSAPAKAKSVALVGKGITFDTGGYAIKPKERMWEMKADMAGAAAVAALLAALPALKPKVNVTAYLPLAENMISGAAYRPGDVITMYSGKRVEVLNTDAEGRLILADAIARASEDSPDYLLETSTLTGGQVIALGKRISGVMGTPELCERVRAAGDRVGEPAWPMPIPDEVRKSMDSEYADIAQASAGLDRSGHMLQGAAFLREFVPQGLPWAHIDIAGPAYHAGEPTGCWTKGGTGVPLRMLLEVIEDIAVNG